MTSVPASTERWAAVGFFGRFVYSEGAWRDEAIGGDYLAIDIHDSDITTIEYRPVPEHGRFYLGFQPRDYSTTPRRARPLMPIPRSMPS